MTPEEFKKNYLSHQRCISEISAGIATLQKLRFQEETRLTELALDNSAALTPLKNGQTVLVNGASFYIEGDVLADVDEETGEIVINLFALNVATGEPTTLHLSPQPGKEWAYELEEPKAPESVEAFLNTVCPAGKEAHS